MTDLEYDYYSFRLNDVISVNTRAVSLKVAQARANRFASDTDEVVFIGKNLKTAVPRGVLVPALLAYQYKAPAVKLEAPAPEPSRFDTGNYADAINKELG
jgi:hypothetical protein